MTYEEIFAKTKEKIMSAENVDYKGHLAVEIDIVGEGSGIFYIVINDGTVDCQPYDYKDHDCKLILSGEDFLAICDGKLDSVKAFTVGKLKVERNIDKALEFSKLVNSLNKQEKAAAKKPAAKKTAEAKQPEAKQPEAKQPEAKPKAAAKSAAKHAAKKTAGSKKK
ncbi:MAG: SCP2 sterol-binding domain-containing protein [Ruminococcus sp.]|nr:SCP2 sterol-binding domain-containing protein [Ruminococcus sp.]